MTTLVIDSLEALESLTDMIRQARIMGKTPTVEFIAESPKKRSNQQNRSLHKYCRMLADALNDAGWDMKQTLKEDVEIPWTEQSAKEHLWKPIQIAMYGVESTTEPETGQYPEIYRVLDRHLAEKTGVSVPWPCRDTMTDGLESYPEAGK